MEIKGCDKQLPIFFVDRRSKIFIRPSYAEGVHHYETNDVQVQLQIFPISPVLIH